MNLPERPAMSANTVAGEDTFTRTSEVVKDLPPAEVLN
jgi:hypothetical protein